MPGTREQVASAAMPPTKSWQRMVELPAAEHLLCGHAISIKSLVEAVEASAVDAKNGDAQSREQDPVLRSTASARLLDELQCCEPCLRRYRQELTGGDGTATPLADNPMDSATTATHLDDAYPEFERRRLLHAIAKIPTARANIPSAKKSAGVAERNAFQRTISEMWRRPWVLRRFPDVHDLFAERFVGYLRALGCALTPSADASDSGTVGTILLFPLHRDVFVRTWGKRLVSKLPEARKGEPLVRAVHVLALRALWDDVMQWLEYHLNQLLRPNDQHTPPNDNCFPLTYERRVTRCHQ